MYILNNSLKQVLALGEDRIQSHSLILGESIHKGLEVLGLEMMTPKDASCRAGNICFMGQDVDRLRSELEKCGVLAWGACARFGRIRVSAHVYNNSDDVTRLLSPL